MNVILCISSTVGVSIFACVRLYVVDVRDHDTRSMLAHVGYVWPRDVGLETSVEEDRKTRSVLRC